MALEKEGGGCVPKGVVSKHSCVLLQQGNVEEGEQFTVQARTATKDRASRFSPEERRERGENGFLKAERAGCGSIVSCGVSSVPKPQCCKHELS